MKDRNKKEKQINENEIIAMPPLKMTLAHVHDEDEHVSKSALQAAIRKILIPPAMIKKYDDPKVVRKLIEYLEKNL